MYGEEGIGEEGIGIEGIRIRVTIPSRKVRPKHSEERVECRLELELTFLIGYFLRKYATA